MFVSLISLRRLTSSFWWSKWHQQTIIRLVIICYQIVDTWPLDKKTRFVWRRRQIALLGSLEAQLGSMAVAENPSQLSRHAAERLWFDGGNVIFALFCGETVRFYRAPPWRRRRVHKSGDGPQPLAAKSLGRDWRKSSKSKSIISISQIFFLFRTGYLLFFRPSFYFL